MKNWFLSFLFLLASCGGGDAEATTYYISKCYTGADAACVAGSDSNDGLSAANPKLNPPAGCTSGVHTCRWARGGSWEVNSDINIFCSTCTKASRLIWNDYTPAWGPGTAKPILVFGFGFGISFTDGGGSNYDEGYTITNMDLRGPAYAASGQGVGHSAVGESGIFIYNDANWITLDGLEINGFKQGIEIAGNNGIADSGNGVSDYITIKNSVINNNYLQGILGAGGYLLIENNSFSDNGFCSSGCSVGALHSIYLSLSKNSPGVIVRGNTITKSAQQSAGACQGIPLVAHSFGMTDAIIENNTIIETTTGTGCYGLTLDSNTGASYAQNHSRAIIRGNKIVLVGDAGAGIGCSACPGAIVENNIIIRLGGTGTFNCIHLPFVVTNSGRGDTADTGGNIVRNNSCYVDAAASTIKGIQMDGASASADIVASNVIVYSANVSASAQCFHYNGRSSGTFTAVDYNTCYRVGGVALWSDIGVDTLAAAQAAGFDANSSTADPGMTTPSSGNSYIFEASSGAAAAINAASPTTGQKSRYGYRGKPLNGARDRGACEYRTADACSAAQASVPSSPTGLR